MKSSFEIDFERAIARSPLTVSSHATVLDALSLMSRARTSCALDSRRIMTHLEHEQFSEHLVPAQPDDEITTSCVLVMDGLHLVGIVTERDMVRLSAGYYGLDNNAPGSAQAILATPITTVMTAPVITLQHSELEDVFTILDRFRRQHIRHLPVVDDSGQVVGMMTPESLRQILRPVDLLRLRLVSEVMSTEVLFALADASVLQVAQLMAQHRRSCVVIVELRGDDREEEWHVPVGIVTERDIIQFQALELDFEQISIAAVMSTPVFGVSPEISLWDAHLLMQQNRINRLVVISPQQKLLGIITQTSLLSVLNPMEVYRLMETLEQRVSRMEADQVAIALQQAELHHQTQIEMAERQRREEELQLLYTLTQEAETSLRYSEARNRAMLTAIPDLMFCVNAEGIYQGYVTAHRELDLVSSEINATGKHLMDVLPPEIAQREMHYLQRALGTGKLQVYEQTVQIGDRLQHEEVRVVPSGDNEVLFMIRDISDRKAAEMELKRLNHELEKRVENRTAALRKSEERWHLALQASDAGIWDKDFRTNQTFRSERWKSIRGLAEDEVGTGQEEWRNRIHPEDRDRVLANFQDYITQNIPDYCIEYRVLHKDGSFRWILDRAQGLWDEAGNILRLVGAETDITDRKLAELALQDSETLYRAVMDGASDAILLADMQGNLWRGNRRAEELLGYSQVELTQLHFTQIHPPQDLERARTGFMTAAQQQRYHMLDILVRRKDGTTIPTDVSCSVITIGEEQFALGIFRDIRDRKHIEAQLRRQEAHLNTAQRIANLGSWEFDPQTSKITWSDEVFRIFGRDPALKPPSYEELQQILHPADCDRHHTLVERAITTGEPYEVEYRFYHTDGSLRYALARGEAILNDQLQITRLVGTVLDVTTQKQAEEELRNLSDRLALAVKSGGIGIWEWVIPTNTLIWDDRMYELYGTRRSDFIGTEQAWVNGLHPDDRDQAIAALHQALVGAEEFTPEFRVMWPDGTVRHLKAYALIHRNQQGEPLKMVGINYDITARKQAEAALRESEARLQAILNYAPAAIYLKDLAGRYLVVNRAFQEVAGKSADQCIGKTDAELFPMSIAARFQSNDQKTLQGRQSCEYEEEIAVDGQRQIFFSIKFPLLDEQGKPYALGGISTDITDRKQAEQKLQQANETLAQSNRQLERATRLKDEFLANMSHELRTPLNAILGMAEGLQEQIFGDLNEQQIKAIATIERSGRHLLELINDILDLSKIEAGKLHLEVTEVSISAVCNHSILFVRQMAQQKNISLRVQMADDIGYIQADDRRLRQILLNLLTNAVKFTPEGGNVTLSVWTETLNSSSILTPDSAASDSAAPEDSLDVMQSGASSRAPTFSQICFTVSDTGIGIAPENLPKLFQSFVQLDSRLNRQHAGTGLGLALVRRLVEMHGGTVTVHSVLGEGSRFTVRLPGDRIEMPGNDHPDEHIPEPSPFPQSSPIPQSQRSVFVIEDSISAAEQLTRHLAEAGLHTHIHNSGTGVLEQVLQLQPALIILDLMLPNLSGWQILAQLKQHPQTQHIPVVIASVLDEREQGLAQGAFDYLVKPITRHDLAKILEQLNAQSQPGQLFLQPQRSPQTNPHPSKRSSPRILMAEDNQANIDSVCDYLTAKGYTLILAKNGQEAIDLAQMEQPDLILMDIQMPTMDGIEAIRRIRADQTIATIPILALTALAMEGDREKCLAAGANDYLCKPVRLRQLADAIQKLVSR
jgi:PAS domain S-box-containing protein